MHLKKIYFTVLFGFLFILKGVWANPGPNQANILILPSENWCQNQNYYKETDTGKIIQPVHYSKALSQNENLKACIQQFKSLMEEKGHQVLGAKNVAQKMRKKINQEEIIKNNGINYLILLDWYKKGKDLSFSAEMIRPSIANRVAAINDLKTADKSTEKILKEAISENFAAFYSNFQKATQGKPGKVEKVRIIIKAGEDFNFKDHCSQAEKFTKRKMFEDAVAYKSNNNFGNVSFTTQKGKFNNVKLPDDGSAKNAKAFAEEIKTLVAKKCEAINQKDFEINGKGPSEAVMVLK